jgi:DNA invertase Pin-like site-specific DNA recombinase
MITDPQPHTAALAFGFAYGRVSSVGSGVDGQSRQEQSIEVQDATFREYLGQINLSADSIRFFQERGSGAFRKQDVRKRREGAKMWNAIVQCRQVHPDADIHLLLTKVDRIGRGFLATQIMFHELREMRVRIHIINLGGKSFDCESLMGQKLLADLAFYSELEVHNTRERIQGTINFKFERSQLCGETPFGFTTRETGEVTGKGVKIRELVDNPDEQKWILHMAALKAAGHTTYRIAQDLNSRRVDTKKAGSIQRVHTGIDDSGVPTTETKIVRNKWTPSKVEKILGSKTTTKWLQSRLTQ